MKPQSAVANMLRETQIATEAAYAPAPQDMQLGYTLGETFGAAAEAGAQQLEGDVKRFGAIYNLIKGDEEQAQKRLNQAEVLSQTSGKILGDLGEFSAFVEEPTVEGFFEQVIKGIGQFTPMAVSSIASGFAGGAVATIGKGVLSSASKKVTNDMMASIVKKHALAKAGKGAALNANEKAILDAAYEAVKKSGQYVNYLNVARAGQAANLGRPASVQAIANFPAASVGFWAGAFGQEYVVGSSQALAEYDEAGYKLTKEEAAAALKLGIPQAVLGTLGERLFVGALFKRAAKDFVKTGDKKFGNYMKEMARGLGGGLLQGGTQEGLTELGQEELLIRQRMAIDPEYSQEEANLRRAESAFVGFWAGGARSAPTSAVANVIGLARSNVEGVSDIVEAIKSGKVTAASKLPQESLRDLTAQTRDMLTPGKPKKGVWVPFQGSETAADKAGYYTAILENLKKQGAIDDKTADKLDFVVDPDGSGFFIYDRSNSESQALANDFQANGFSEGQLRKNLGYSYEQDASQTDAVVVRDKDGNEIHAESIPNEEALKPKEEQSVLAKLEQEYAKQIAEEGYTVKQETKEDVVNTRNKKIEAEVRGFEGEENIDPETGEIVDDEAFGSDIEMYGQGVTIQDAPDEGPTPVTEDLAKGDKKPVEGAKFVRQENLKFKRERRAEKTFPQIDKNAELEGLGTGEQAARRQKRTELEEKFYEIIGPKERTTWVSETVEEFGRTTEGRINTVPDAALQEFINLTEKDTGSVYSLELNKDNNWSIIKERTQDSKGIIVEDELPDVIQAAIRSSDLRSSARREFALKNGWSIKRPGKDKFEAIDISLLIDFASQVNQQDGGLTTDYTTSAGFIADSFDTVLDLLAQQTQEGEDGKVKPKYVLRFAGKPLSKSPDWVNAPLYTFGNKSYSYNQAVTNRGEKINRGVLNKTQANLLNKVTGAEERIKKLGKEKFGRGPKKKLSRELTEKEKIQIARENKIDYKKAGDALPTSFEINQLIERFPKEEGLQAFLNEGATDRMDIDIAQSKADAILEEQGYLYTNTKVDEDSVTVVLQNEKGATEALSSVTLRTRDEDPRKTKVSPTTFGPLQKQASPSKKANTVEVGSDVQAVLKGLVPVMRNIVNSYFGKRKDLRILSVKQVIEGTGVKNISGSFMFDGKEHQAADIVSVLAEKMRGEGKKGKWIKFADSEVILLNIPDNPSPVQLAEVTLTLGHELGHSIYNQVLDNALINKNMRQRLQKSFEADKKRIGTAAYEGKYGFEEWFSDQMGAWLSKEMAATSKQADAAAKDATESFFKRLAQKIIGVFRQLDQMLQKRFTINMDFDAYVSELSEAILSSEPSISVTQEIEIRDMVDDVASGVHDAYMPKPLRVRIKNKAVQTLKTMGELLPTDRRHWGVEYLFLPAHNVLKRVLTRAGLDPAFADMIYSPSQSKAATGTLNGRISLMYMRLNELGKLAPQKKNGEPDIDAWEATLKEAEDDTLAYGQLSPEAKKVRRFLETFYKDNIEGKDSLIKFRENFYPRIINMEALLDNGNGERAALASVIVKHNNIPLEAAERHVEKMLQENKRNPDDPQDTVSEVSLGMAKERSVLFTKIPNKDLRDIGVLQDPYVALVTYVQDMTKRIDYKERVTAQVTQADINNAKKLAKETRQKNINLKQGEKLDNPLGFLLKSGVTVGQEFNGWQASEIHINRIADPRERAKARNAVRSMLGVVGGIKSKPLRQLNNFMLAFNVVTMLTFAALASLPDLGGTVLRSKDFGAIKTFGQQMRKYFNDREQARAFARDVGVVSFDSLNTMYLNAAELGFMGEWSKFATEKFFIATGLEAYTKFTRVFAAGMGEQFLVTKAADNSDIATRHLEELQITREDIKKWVKNGRSFETAEGEKVRAAIARFVDESIMRPNSAERPGWASSPHFAVVWQLKSFFYAYGKNIIGGTLREANNRYSEDGKLTSAAIPLVLGATALLPLTMLGLEIRELIKYFGRGMDPAVFRSDNMTWPQYTGEIIDRSGALGAFGLIIPMLDAGKYGGQWWVPPLGPTAERVEKLMNGKVRGKDFLPFYDLGAGELLGL